MRLPLLLACACLAAPVVAQQTAPARGYATPPAQPAPTTVQPLPGTTDADLLASAMRRVGANSNDLAALLDAGDYSVRVGDLSAAAAFFARAERIDPRSGRAKAGEGAILVRAERPGEALRYFAMAESYGAPATALASDRGWAYDLIGENERAQRTYRAALKVNPGDSETVRRYALSLGIAGKQKLALDTLAPQIRAGDRGAWRDRAFIEAMGGDQAEAQRIATTMLPPGVSIGLLPFLRLLPSLGAADRAFAVHFGVVRATPERLADARLTPLLPALGPDPDPPRVAVAAAEPAPRVERPRRGRRPRGVELAAREPAPEPVPPIPTYQGGAPGYPAGYGAANRPAPPATPLARAFLPAASTAVARAPVTAARPGFVAPPLVQAPTSVPPAVAAIAARPTFTAPRAAAVSPTPPAVLAAVSPVAAPPSGSVLVAAIPGAASSLPLPAAAVPTPGSLLLQARPTALATRAPIVIGPATASATQIGSTAALGVPSAVALPPTAAPIAGPARVAASPPVLAATSGAPALAPATIGAAVSVPAPVPAAVVAALSAPAPSSRITALPAPAPAPASLAPSIGDYLLAPPVSQPAYVLAATAAPPAPGRVLEQSGGNVAVAPVGVPAVAERGPANGLAPTGALLASTTIPTLPSSLASNAASVAAEPSAASETASPSTAPTLPEALLAMASPSPALTQLVAALPIPGAELGVGRAARPPAAPSPAAAPATDTSAADAAAAQAKAALDDAARQAAAERVAKRSLAAKALTDKRAADRKAAADKQALADKKAAAEAKAEADREAAAEKKAARSNPSRIWVQVAGGASQGDLPDAWAAAKAKAPEIFTGHASGWTTPLRATNRVLAGPFKTNEEARAFINALAKKGLSGFPFTSKAGQAIAKLPKE